MLRNLGIVSFALCIVISFAIRQPKECMDIGIAFWTDRFRYHCQSPPGIPRSFGFREDYKLVPDLGYYKFHTEPLPWNVARDGCFEEDAHLAIIDDKVEAEALGKIFKELYANISQSAHNKHLAWLGVHDQCKEGKFRTVVGSSFNATDDVWEKGYKGNKDAGITPLTCKPDPKQSAFDHQPDNGGMNGNQDCAALIRECNTMDDNRCDLLYAFFSEKPICAFTIPEITLN